MLAEQSVDFIDENRDARFLSISEPAVDVFLGFANALVHHPLKIQTQDLDLSERAMLVAATTLHNL